jgi:outer membrane protein OmpA-like peptidoglycan-associated protein
MKFADQRFRRSSAIPTDTGMQSIRPAETTASGRALEPDTRGFFERRFGHDFSRVRVHADTTAASSARSVAAAAYTLGTDIVFGAGMYRPDSPSGTRLLAHELAHVVQQDRGGGATAGGGDHESEARAASDRIVTGQRPAVTLSAPTGIQRQPLSGAPPDLTEGASPILAAAIGSVTLDGFDTGKSVVSENNRTKLMRTAETIAKLFVQYPASTVRVIGYTDAVGKESDNQVLGQSRADAVQAALLDMGVAGAAVKTESRGANDPVVRSTKAEARNRRVEVRFDPSRLLRGAFSEGLTPPTMTPPAAGTTTEPGEGKRVDTGIGNLCLTNPALCYGTGQGYPGGPTTLSPGALQPVPDLTPYHLMDVSGPYTSHGGSQSQGGDLRATWRALYEKYRWKWGLPEKRAADLANSEMSGTANKDLSRDNPNAADRLDREMQNANPDAKKVGPADITIFRF